MVNFLNEAMKYASDGYAVFPLCPNSKIPLIKGGRGCLDATTDIEQIMSLWSATPSANIGIATGRGLIAVDIDIKNGQAGLETLQYLINEGLNPDTRSAVTPSGGFHYLFRVPDSKLIQNTVGILPGLDIRSDGGYIVAAPSVTAKGNYYWQNPCADILPAPEFLIDLLIGNRRSENSSFSVKSPFRAPDSIKNNRNTTLLRMACSLFSKNLSPDAVWAALEVENNGKCYEPLPTKELQRLFRSAVGYNHQNHETHHDGQQERFTDLANANRLIEEHGEYIRYIPAFKKWFVFDGCRWMNNPPGGLFPIARRTLERLYQYAMTLEGENRSRLLREIMGLEALHRQKAMIETATTIPAIIIEPNQLDCDSYLLNVHNGTLDLRTGSLKPHDSSDMITKLAPISFDPSASCPTWEQCIFKIMAGNTNMIGFLRRALGYSLTGDTREQCFFIPYGSGANGKSTVLNIFKVLLGDYAMQAAPDMLMVKNNQGGANNDLARLPGARFVATSETEDGQRFAESALKQMTGQDTITARFLYGEFFEFTPQFKIWLATNHRPVVRGTDNAIWRRIHLIPFTVTIPEEEQDKHLDAKLQKELPGIINWALAGCLEWQQIGLQPPDEVKKAVSAYRKDMDIFSQWLDECCVQVPNALTLSRTLYESYETWCKENTGWAMKPTKFGRTLTDHGFISVKTPHAAWRGIGLLLEEHC